MKIKLRSQQKYYMDRFSRSGIETLRSEKGHRMEQLSGVMIIIIIGGGVLTFVALFIFAKRQIMRFTIRSRRGPHVPVGNDAKKVEQIFCVFGRNL